jgi:putative hydrolase of the HAD superfamily
VRERVHNEKKYHHLFFDLDRTLWDFDASARQTFEDIYNRYKLYDIGIESVDKLIKVFSQHNDMLWDQYRQGVIEKDYLRGVRFELTLKSFGINDVFLAEHMSDDYVYFSPRNVHLFPYAAEVLSILYERYPLHLITNGFKEVQVTKLEQSGLGRFFATVTTSEEAGVKKPEQGIFSHALAKSGALASESIMIGDDLMVDIEGAARAGMDTVFFNPDRVSHQHNITYEIQSLRELAVLFG